MGGVLSTLVWLSGTLQVFQWHTPLSLRHQRASGALTPEDEDRQEHGRHSSSMLPPRLVQYNSGIIHREELNMRDGLLPEWPPEQSNVSSHGVIKSGLTGQVHPVLTGYLISPIISRTSWDVALRCPSYPEAHTRK